MEIEQDSGHDPVGSADNHSQFHNERRHRLETLFRVAHTLIQEKSIGRFNRDEIYEERLLGQGIKLSDILLVASVHGSPGQG